MPTVTRRTTLKGYRPASSEYFKKYFYPASATLKDVTSQQQAGSTYTLNGTAPISRNLIENVFTSVSTPGYYVKKKVNVQWVPAKYSLSPPRIPRFNPPVLPKLKPFKANASKAFIARCTRRFEARLRTITKRRQDYIERYNIAYSRYLQRKERYLHYLWLKANGVVKYRRMRSTEKILVRNPYNRTMTFDYGAKGYASEMITSSSSDTLVGAKDGKYCYYKGFTLYTDVPYFYAFPADPVITLNTTSAAESRAIHKLYSKLNDQNVHIGNMIAERAQTFSMLSDIMRRLVALKKGNLSPLLQYVEKGGLKKISDDFLAFKFGVEPLMQDAYSATEALKKLLETQQADKIIVRVGSKVTNVGDKVTKTSVRTTTTTLTETVKVSYSLEYKIVNSASASAQQLGLLNPAEIAWEMVPWSFVVDWFLPIGNYINSLSAEAGLTFISGTKTVVTTKHYHTIIDEPKNYSGPSNRQHYTLFLDGKRSVETKVRTVLSSAPKPVLPNFKNPLSATHVLESLALLIQHFRR